MRLFALAIMTLGGAVWTWAAQPPDSDPATDAPGPRQMLAVELTRLVVTDTDDVAERLANSPSLSSEIRNLEQAGKVKVQERIGLTALEDQPSRAQFGRRVPIVVGETVSRGGVRTERTQYTELGTLVQVIARVEADEVRMELTYESSYHEASNGDDQPPSTAITSVSTTLSLKLGEAVLVTSARSEDQSLLLVSVSTRNQLRIRPGRSGQASSSRSRPQPRTRRQQPTSPADRAALLAEGMFGRYDRNGDNEIDQEEVDASSVLKRRFGEYDANDDGKITLEEMTESIQARIRPDR